MRPAPHVRPRRGVTLLEVLASLTIFLISFTIIGGLISLAADRAIDVQYESLAAQMCQSKLNEVAAGVVPLQSASGSIEEDPEWNWALEATQASNVTNLWTVTVRVYRPLPTGGEISVTLAAMIMDPSIRGNASDKPATSDTGTTTSSSSSSTTSSSSSSSSSTTPAASSGGGAGGAAPSAPQTTPQTTPQRGR